MPTTAGPAGGVDRLPVQVAILAGGAGTRLIRGKALLPVGGRPIIRRVLDAVRTLSASPLIVTNAPDDYEHLGLPMADDLHPGKGPLGGIATAIEAAGAARVLVLAADLPFLRPALLDAVVAHARKADCVVPRWQRRLQPLHALYGTACAGPIARMLEAGSLCPLDLYPLVRTHIMPAGEVAAHDPDGMSFLNVNTPQELALAREIAGAVGDPSCPMADQLQEVAAHEAG